MEKNLKHFKHVRDPTKALQAAVSNLEKFSYKNESSPIASAADLTVREGQLIATERSSLQRAIDFIAVLFSNSSRQKLLRQKQQVQHAVLEAIDVVKRNHLFIGKLKGGSPVDKQLATSTLAAINHYNSTLDSIKKTPADWTSRIVNFFYKYSGLVLNDELKSNRIDLPEASMLPCNIPDQQISLPFQANVIVPSGDPLFIQEADAIRMKASTLLKHHGIRFKTPGEAVASLKHAPIHATLDVASMTSNLCLTLQVLPGTTIKVRGSFIRNSHSQTSSTPIVSSFHLAFNSIQTGFPHPAQYAGWALSDALIPTYPLHLEELPLFAELYSRRKIAATGLSSEGSLLEPAKRLHRLKQAAFDMELLNLHRELGVAIIGAAHLEPHVVSGHISIIERFFAALEQCPAMFDYLSETYHMINMHFIKRPFTILQEAWLEQSVAELFSSDPFEVSHAAIKILSAEKEVVCKEIEKAQESASLELEKCALGYIRMLGDLLGSAVQAIMLQHLSETLNCAPPTLNEFEQKLQAAAYHQLQTFLEELDGDSSLDAQSVQTNLGRNLAADIALFQSPLSHPLPQELEEYFNSRYYAQLSSK